MTGRPPRSDAGTSGWTGGNPALCGLLLWVLLLAACGGGDATDAEVNDHCEGLASRWVVLHQEYLDQLDAAAGGAAAIEAAHSWLGSAMVEQVRDATAVGCQDEPGAGAPPSCSQVTELSASGVEATKALDFLSTTCGS